MACEIWADNCEEVERVKQWGWKQARSVEPAVEPWASLGVEIHVMKAAWSGREILPENFTSALKSSAFISVLLTFLGSTV